MDVAFLYTNDALRSSKKLALSFREMERDDEHQIVVVPPLIRREITAIQPEEGNYIHGYMVNAGFADTVESFHTMHPEVPLRFFWDKTETEEVVRVDETLSYHQIDDVKFLNGMANCRLMPVRLVSSLFVKRCILANRY